MRAALGLKPVAYSRMALVFSSDSLLLSMMRVLGFCQSFTVALNLVTDGSAVMTSPVFFTRKTMVRRGRRNKLRIALDLFT